MGWHSWNWAASSSFSYSAVVEVAYETIMLQRYGATLGKMLLGLTVVHDGLRLSWQRALGRGLARQLSGMICFIGYLIAAVDSKNKALHDHICQTSVYFKPKKASSSAATQKAKKPKKARRTRKAQD